MNMVKGLWRDGAVNVGTVSIPVARPMTAADGQEVLIGLRPEHLSLSEGVGSLPARVEVIEPTGADTMLMCKLGEEDMVAVVRDRVTLRPGDDVRLRPELDKLHVFDARTGASLAS
jgi:multiple sugar transport system ATP-binding protein